LAPFISCTARLAVYMMFCFIFFPNNTQNVIFFLYVVGILMAIMTGLLMRGKSRGVINSHMVMELPEYKFPKIKTIIHNSVLRTKSFIFGAGKMIVAVFFIIHLINIIKIPIKNVTTGVVENTNLIHIIAKKITPIFAPFGLKEKNWPAAVGLVTGIFAKEVVVGTLVSLYADDHLEEVNNDGGEYGDVILKKYQMAFMSIPQNLKLAFANNDVGQNSYSEENKLSNTIINNIRENFDDRLAVLSYLIFILLYIPCVSVFGVITNEIGKKWAVISALWSTISAYSVAIIFYQTANIIVNITINYPFLLLGIILFFGSALSLNLASRKLKKE
jgi:ferrous iron transport protein B